MARVPKLRAPCPIGLAHLVWSLGSGHADGNVTVLLMGHRGQAAREDGVQPIPPIFPLFPFTRHFFFSLSLSDLAVNPDHLAARHGSTTARSQILPLLASNISNVAMHRVKKCSIAGDRMSDGARCGRPRANPLVPFSLPNWIQTGSGPTWRSATWRVLGM